MDKQLPINNNEVVKEYLKILLDHGFNQEHKETKELVDYIADMERHYSEMSQELNEIKKLLYSLQNPQTKSRLANAVKKTEAIIIDGTGKITTIKNKVIASMKDSIQSFKQKGKDGVIKTINILHFKEGLNGVRKSFFYSMKHTQNLVQTTDMLTSEVRQAKSHLKRVGYILLRKPSHIKTADYHKLNMIQKSVRFIHYSFEKMTIQTTYMLHRLEDFEKPSVKKEIKYLENCSKDTQIPLKKKTAKTR